MNNTSFHVLCENTDGQSEGKIQIGNRMKGRRSP